MNPDVSKLATAPAAAFTLVEVLAALMFLAILVPVVVEGITLANRASEITERSTVAAGLCENKLAELTLDNTWATAPVTKGDFGQDYTGYRWEANQATWEMDNMTKLAVDVFYNVQGRERSVRLSTLVTTATNSTSGTNSLTGQ